MRACSTGDACDVNAVVDNDADIRGCQCDDPVHFVEQLTRAGILVSALDQTRATGNQRCRKPQRITEGRVRDRIQTRKSLHAISTARARLSCTWSRNSVYILPLR